MSRNDSDRTRKRPVPGQVTIVDVAKKAGVSTATAARVLGQYGSVSEKTRKIVQQAANELNYVPNALARSMVKLKTHTLGLLVPDIRNAFFGTVAQSVAKSAKKAGYRIIMCDTGADYDTECSYLNDLSQQRVDGIILASSVPFGQRHDMLAKVPCPVVLIDRMVTGANLDCVRADHKQGAYDAIKYLLSLGHRRISIVLGTSEESVHHERFQGYQTALNEAGIEVDPVLVKKRDWEIGLTAVDELFALPEPPTAIFSTNNVITVGVLADLKRLGKRIPDDVAFISFDEIGLASLLETPLTEIAQDPTLIGATAMEILLQRIDDGDNAMPPQEVIFPPTLIKRASCGEQKTAQEAPA